jgi:hypothetical protein
MIKEEMETVYQVGVYSHPIHHNKMVKLNENSLHCMARYDPSLMQLDFQPSYVPDYGHVSLS